MKRLKRIGAVFLTLSILWSMAVTVYSETKTIINDDFENEISSSVWTGDYEIESGLNPCLKSAADKTQFYCRLDRTVTKGAMVISYDVLLPEFSAIRIKQVWDAASGGKRAYLIQSTATGKLTIENTELGTYTPGKWFNLTEVVDMDQKKTAVYLDGSYVNEYAWRANGEAVGINNIQTQYDKKEIAVDNVYVAAYDNKTEADAALEQMLSQKLSLEKSDFTVGANQTVCNTIPPITSGAEIISYDITTTGKARLMQIYDDQTSAKRAVLIQVGAKGTIVVNGKDTGVQWEQNRLNTLTLIYDAAERTSTVYYNGIRAGSANYAVHSDNGLNLADIRTQNEGSGTLTVSGAWTRKFADCSDAIKFYHSFCNMQDSDVLNYYQQDRETAAKAVKEYLRELDALACTETKSKETVEKIWNLLPYTKIFIEDFDETESLSGYMVAEGATVEEGTLKLASTGERARVLKSVPGHNQFVCEFDFKQKEISNIGSLIRITDDNTAKEAIRLYTENGKLNLSYGTESGTSYKTLLNHYSVDRWYRIKLYVDGAAQKTYVYINGTLRGVYDFISRDIENLNRVFDTYTEVAGAYYIDNIRIYQDALFEPNLTENIKIPVRVTEMRGAGIKNQLFRRGFALEESQIYDPEELMLADENGDFVPSVISAMEQYEDGSVKWALLSFVCSLPSNGEQNFYIVRSDGNEQYGLIDFENGLLENEKIKIQLSEQGISGISVHDEKLIQNLYLYYNDKTLPFSGYEIIQKNDLYIKVRLHAESDGVMRGEMMLTLWQGSEDVDIEYRLTALKDTSVTDMGCVLEGAENMQLTDEESGICVSGTHSAIHLTSNDLERFRGAVSEDTGFFIEENQIRFAPILHNAEFTWYDGMTRTNHLRLSTNNGADTLAALKNPAAVVISPEQFVKSGIIESSSHNAVLDRIIGSFQYAYDKRNGCFEAGYIPWIIDEARKKVDTPTMQHGETDYNLALLQLSYGNTMLYNMIGESAECRADVAVYKGSVADAYGAVRYRTGSHLVSGDYRFKTSHPYYGEASGLYMAYLLSGNEYIRETFLDVTEHIYQNIESGNSALGKYPSMVSWENGIAKKANYGESRYMIQIRPLMMANALTGDEKYKAAANAIIEWAENAQTKDGYWYQAYYDDKKPLTQSGQTQAAVKNYIMLYGARGLSYCVKNEQNETAEAVLEKFSDFLCNEIEQYGAGLWSPTGNVDLYEENEDGTRGKSAMQDIMAAEILFRTYAQTQNEKYLDGCLKSLNAWISALGPGGLPASVSYLQGYYDGSVSSAQASQNLTVISFIGELEKFLSDHEQLIYQKGFGQLCEVFRKDSSVVIPINQSNAAYPELTSSLYNNNALFVMNVNGKSSGRYQKEYRTASLGNELWCGMKNLVNTDGSVSLIASLNQFDLVSAMRCPITLSGNNTETEISVDEYNSDRIEITLHTNQNLNLVIRDGIFDTENGYYSCKTELTDEGVRVTIENVQTGIPKTGTIAVSTAYTPARIAGFRLLDSAFRPTNDVKRAEYIEAVRVETDGENPDVFIAQYNENQKLTELQKTTAEQASGQIRINPDTATCKIMVWKEMQPKANSLIIEGLNGV